jgi:hypothetical protein
VICPEHSGAEGPSIDGPIACYRDVQRPPLTKLLVNSI